MLDSGKGPIDTLPDCRHSDRLNIWFQNSYAVFCFIKRGLDHASGISAAVRPQAVLAARGKPVAFGQTAPTSYAGRTTRGGSATSRLAGSLAVHVAGAEVEIQYRPRMLEALQGKVNAVVESVRDQTPACSQCGQPMRCHDTESVSWIARFGCLQAAVARYRCPVCKDERRPRLDLLGVEPGRISGSRARLLAALAVVAPYTWRRN